MAFGVTHTVPVLVVMLMSVLMAVHQANVALVSVQVNIRGVDIQYETAGTGTPVVWGHGLTSSRADDLMPPVMVDWDRVAQHAQVTRYDARGHGISGYTPEPEGYTWAELAQDQLAFLSHLQREQGHDRVALGGVDGCGYRIAYRGIGPASS